MKNKLNLIITIAVLLLTGCGSPQAETVTVKETVIAEVPVTVEVVKEIEVTRLVEVEVTRVVELEVTPVSTETPVPSPTPEVSAMSAEMVLETFSEAGLPIGESIIFTAETDPNELLGRPNGYTSKVNFRDTRLSVEYTDEVSTSDGGSIEVYPNAEGATLRAEYIQALGGASPLFVEYHYQQGGVLLRLSNRLLPDQAEDYGDVIANLFE